MTTTMTTIKNRPYKTQRKLMSPEFLAGQRAIILRMVTTGPQTLAQLMDNPALTISRETIRHQARILAETSLLHSVMVPHPTAHRQTQYHLGPNPDGSPPERRIKRKQPEPEVRKPTVVVAFRHPLDIAFFGPARSAA